MLEYIINYSFLVSILPLAGFLFKFWQYVDVRRREQKQLDFDNYHKLVERLSRPLGADTDPYLDVQRAAIFELRHYKRYGVVSKEILKSWKDKPEYKSIAESTLKKIEK